MKKTTYAAAIKYIGKDGMIDFHFWGGWDDRETATEVLENLKAVFSGMRITQEYVMTDAAARNLAQKIWG